ncbi:probable E3 ubiquitin-protein ligase XERICO isoform X2 [Cornus florida]|nr:probable E3 ubiquitin-protein ligase XERICO isoform X2 [Cornus florida]XP_059662847.1 probable E3 ubiquitin-protein ligase XERICO isoform X2 [Cornus florida]
MGLANMSPTEEGKVIVIVASALLSIWDVKDMFVSMLRFVGIHIASAFRFVHLRRPEQEECSICQTEFKPVAQINILPCGHVFHKLCLEKWRRNCRVTCPNCYMTPTEEESRLLAILRAVYRKCSLKKLRSTA